MNEDSFWVIPDKIEIRTPIAILREQATLLTNLTKGILKGEIETTQSNDNLLIKLYIVVSGLKNYRYLILQYIQPITLYPGTLIWAAKSSGYQTANEDQFLDSLKTILSSTETQSVITGLLAQARETAPPTA